MRDGGSVRTILWYLALALVTSVIGLGLSGANGVTFEAAACLLLLAGTVGALGAWTASQRLIPALVIVILFGLAYAPGSLDAMSFGMANSATTLPTSPEHVQAAILLLVLFLVVTTAIAVWVANRVVLVRVANSAIGWVGGGARSFAIAAFAFFAVVTLVAFRSGFWSAYGGDSSHAQSGGFRLELLYSSLLVAMFSLAGRHLGYRLWEASLSPARILVRLVPWLALLALIFIQQSRRWMATALIVTGADPLLAVIQGNLKGRLPMMRLAIAGVTAIVLLVGLFLGSALWRESAQEQRSSQWDEQITNTVRGMGTRSVEVDSATRSAAERFTYLWIDSIALDYADRSLGVGDIYDVLYSSLVTATPGVILPDKYEHPLIRCESAFAMLGVEYDLACTPITEGIMFGGVGGFCLVALLFGIGVGFACLVYRQGSDAGLVLSCVMLIPFAEIECGGFPVFLALRGLLITGGFLALATSAVRMTTNAAPKSASSADDVS